MNANRRVQTCLENGHLVSEGEDIFVNVTLRCVPCDLLREFARKVVVNYSGGMSEAVQDLMRRATE